MSKKRKACLRVCFCGMLVFWMVLIFSFSGQDGEKSGSVSKGSVEIALEILYPGHTAEDIETKQMIVEETQLLIRKSAHFLIYAGLGFWSLGTLYTFSVNRRIAIPMAVLFCFFYASVDEMHQYFVPGRSGAISDVYLDTLGAVAMIAVMTVVEIHRHPERYKGLRHK